MRRARLATLLLALLAPAASAQWQLSADLGGARLDQPGLGRSNAAIAGLTFDFANEYTLLRSSALGAKAGTEGSTRQWLTIASAVTPSWKGVALQGTGTFSLFDQSTPAQSTSADAVAQLRVGAALRGFAVGYGYGRSSLDIGSWPVQRGVADAWWVASADRFALNATLANATVFVFDEYGASPYGHGRYLDMTANWSHAARAWTVGAAAGFRSPRDPSRHATWASANAMLWFAPHAAMSLEAGRALDDLVRAVPGTRYISLGLKFAVNPHASLASRRGAPAGPRITVSRAPDDLRRVELTLPGVMLAERVELMADFTDWTPVALERVGGSTRWRLERAIAPGPHRLAIRVNDGEWIAPANLPSVEDDLGGRVGILTTP